MDNLVKPKLIWLAFKLIDKSENRIVLLEMLKLLSKQFDVRLMAGYRKKQIPIVVAGHPVRYYNRSGILPLNVIRTYFSQCQEIHRLFCEPPVDLVFLSHGPSLFMMKKVLRDSQKAKAAIIFDVRTLPTKDVSSRAFKMFGQKLSFAARHFNGITYITDEIRRYCLERFKLSPHTSAVWTSGVNADTFTIGSSPSDEGTFRFIYHGGIISVNRGLDKLIQAMNLVRDLNVQLSLVSSLREPEAVAWIDRMNLRDRVVLTDTIPHVEVPAVIQNHHAGILPFPDCEVWNTSSPIKLFEYMACGKPVVVTDIPAHHNVLAGKPFAYFAKDASPEALAGAIRAIYADREKLADLGIAARQQVLECHTWERQAKVLGTFLKNLIK